MKGLDDNKPKIEVREKENKKQEIRYIGSLKNPLDGRKLWEFNMRTGELLPVEPKRTVAVDANTMQPIYSSKIETNQNCYYFWCLNQRSAVNHLFKRGYLKSKQVSDTQIVNNEDNMD